MTLLKTKVNIVFTSPAPRRGAPSVFLGTSRRATGGLAARINAKSNDAGRPFAVAISAETTTFREPSGREYRCEGRSGA